MPPRSLCRRRTPAGASRSDNVTSRPCPRHELRGLIVGERVRDHATSVPSLRAWGQRVARSGGGSIPPASIGCERRSLCGATERRLTKQRGARTSHENLHAASGSRHGAFGEGRERVCFPFSWGRWTRASFHARRDPGTAAEDGEPSRPLLIFRREATWQATMTFFSGYDITALST